MTDDISDAFPVALARLTALASARQRFRARARAIEQLTDERPPRWSKPEELQELEDALAPEERQRAQAAVDVLAEDSFAELYGTLSGAGDDGSVLFPYPEDLGLLALGEAATSALEAVRGRLAEAGSDPRCVSYALQLLQWRTGEEPAQVQGTALLASLVAGFEEFLGALLRTWHLAHNEGAGAGAEERLAALVAASRFAAELARQEPAAWCRVVTDDLGVPLEQVLGPRWPQVCEVAARRRSIVQAGARADRRYLERLAGGAEQPPLGASLACDRAYLEAAIDLLQDLADLLVVGAGAPFGTDAVAELASPVALHALQHGHWEETRFVASVALKALPADHEHHDLRVNLWMAAQEAGDGESVRDDVTAWEPPEGAGRFLLAKAALLDDVGEAVAAFDATLAEGTHSAHELHSWPLVERLSERSPEFRKHVQLALVGRGAKRPAPVVRPKHRRR